jgi:FK506-binding protein 2
MCVGEVRKLGIPAELGYGPNGAPPRVPGNADLVFEVEMLDIRRRDGDL